MKQAKVLTTEEINSAISDVMNYSGKWAKRNRMLLLLSHHTGMRVVEMSALRLSDVLDIHGRVLSEINLAAHQTKGSQGRRVILPSRTQTEISKYLQHQWNTKSLQGLVYQAGNQPLFYSQKLNAFTPNQLSQVFSRIYRDAGIVGATSHSGRRSWITALCSKGANVRAIQMLAGHRSLSTTQKYVELGDHVLKAVAELI